ncbi:hypothetical protein Tco_0105281 [Tanacetum coccineum]
MKKLQSPMLTSRPPLKHNDENIAHRYQTDKLVEASMSSLDKSSTATSDLYKGLNIITQLLKEIKTASKMTMP